jgi:hypothetical protein
MNIYMPFHASICHFMSVLNGSFSCLFVGRILDLSKAQVFVPARPDIKIFWDVPCLSRASFPCFRPAHNTRSKCTTLSTRRQVHSTHIEDEGCGPYRWWHGACRPSTGHKVKKLKIFIIRSLLSIDGATYTYFYNVSLLIYSFKILIIFKYKNEKMSRVGQRSATRDGNEKFPTGE